MKQINAYIDGFNLYHAIVNLNDNKLKWLDLRKLCENFVPDGYKLNKIYYFSAVPTHLGFDKTSRHNLYIKALESVGVTPILGNFKRKKPTCKICHRQYDAYEEKESDINIAISMLKDAFLDNFDRAFLITADTDLVSTIQMIKANFPSKTIVLLPPPKRDRYAHELKQNAHISLEIKNKHLLKSLLPDIIKYNGQTINKPIEYN